MLKNLFREPAFAAHAVARLWAGRFGRWTCAWQASQRVEGWLPRPVTGTGLRPRGPMRWPRCIQLDDLMKDWWSFHRRATARARARARPGAATALDASLWTDRSLNEFVSRVNIYDRLGCRRMRTAHLPAPAKWTLFSRFQRACERQRRHQTVVAVARQCVLLHQHREIAKRSRASATHCVFLGEKKMFFLAINGPPAVVLGYPRTVNWRNIQRTDWRVNN